MMEIINEIHFKSVTKVWLFDEENKKESYEHVIWLILHNIVIIMIFVLIELRIFVNMKEMIFVTAK